MDFSENFTDILGDEEKYLEDLKIKISKLEEEVQKLKKTVQNQITEKHKYRTRSELFKRLP